MASARYRVAIVASHPVQYQAPWYRALTELVDLRVFFAHRITADDHARSGFGVGFDWDVPLLDGYPHEWLTNVAARPGIEHFSGCDTPGVGDRLARGRYDAVVVNGWQLRTYWQAIRGARRAGIPVMVRGDSQLQASPSLLRRSAKRLVYPRLLRQFDAYLAVGRRSAEYYAHYGIGADRIHASPHCVDGEWFAAAAVLARSRREEIRRALGIPERALVWLFAGKLVEKKRPLDFVGALAAAGSETPDVWGLIVGDGPLRSEVEAACRAQGSAVLAGFRNQRAMADMYAVSDGIVLPSDGRETWGLVVNEAMACGLPAVVSDAAGCAPDLIVHGETGYTFPCGDVRALTKRLIEAAGPRDRLASLGAAARDHVRRRYSPGVAARGVVAAVEALRPQLTGQRERVPA